jgi:hypothetical protein
MFVMWGRVKGPQQMLRRRPSASSSDASSRVMAEPSSRPRVEAQQVPRQPVSRPEMPLASGARRRGRGHGVSAGVEWIQEYVQAGVNEVYCFNVGKNQRELIDVFGERVLPVVLG